jgi:hypothetical protein
MFIHFPSIFHVFMLDSHLFAATPFLDLRLDAPSRHLPRKVDTKGKRIQQVTV